MSEHKFLLRVPGELWDRLVLRAGRERRSANGEIVRLIEAGLERDAAGGPFYSRMTMDGGYETTDSAGRVVDPPPRREVRPDFKGGQ